MLLSLCVGCCGLSSAVVAHEVNRTLVIVNDPVSDTAFNRRLFSSMLCPGALLGDWYVLHVNGFAAGATFPALGPVCWAPSDVVVPLEDHSMELFVQSLIARDG